MTTPTQQVIDRVLAVYGRWGRNTSPAQMRKDWDELFSSDVDPKAIEWDLLAGVECAWIGDPTLSRDKLFIYLHGGGYQVGSIRSHMDMVSRISAQSGIIGLAVNYRLAPEHQFPAPIEECVRIVDHLRSIGVETGNIVIAGDSAGGNLALATVLSLKRKHAALPAAIVLMSPWTDLEARGESYETRAKQDPIHHRNMILHMAGNYLGKTPAATPLASPLNADLTGFPPTLIQVGDRETVLDDSRNLAKNLEAVGVDVECQVWDDMIHVFQQFPDELEDARTATRQLADFIRLHLT